MVKRVAIIDKNKCKPNHCGNYWCIGACPVNRTGEECIIKDENIKKAAIIEEMCIGCGICLKCPFDAIQIVNLPEELKESPIHRFGINSFRLYGLPLPKKNTILGILGRNGIGKTTALQILSKLLKPNLGEYNKEINEEDIIKLYSNNILGDYLKNLFNNKIKISYKPQRIELLNNLYRDNIIDLLKKIDERNLSEKLIEELNLEDLKNRKLNELSGGELQKTAIIACLIKDADIYYFDEPMSFLDITTRMKVSRIIKKLTLNKSVIIIEHDLTSLDYISDEIQIVYGRETAYGIFSKIKSTARGINEYLEGYLPEENIRFRDYSIKFSESPIEKEVHKEKLFEFPELKKSYSNFALDIKGGKVNKGEVICVVGANGLGKTTFLKLLAGLEKPDNCKLNKINISYKPQYLDNNNESTVLEYLQGIAKENFNSGWYKQNVFEKLNLGKLINNKIRELSGGELQKVYIAASLSKDCELIAMDEPSAFIDVEDRLKVAEIIKDFVMKKECSALIVDHDIQFIDYLADSILVFKGTAGKKGEVEGILNKREGMNLVLKNLDITYRKDKTSFRPRINKIGSQLDLQQRKKGEYYYL
jgi:ATP-binding cassette subfamily E protein 1